MARDEYENDYTDRGGYGHGDGASSSGHGGQTSELNTTLISDDGRVLGFKLPTETAKQLRIFRAPLLEHFSNKLESYGIPWGSKFAKHVLGATEHEAAHFGGKAGNAIAYGVIFSNEIANIGRNIYDSVQSLNGLRRVLKPLASAGGANHASPLSGKNEVVANYRKKIIGVGWQRLAETATGAIAMAPTLIGRISRQAVKNADREEQLELQRIKDDPEAMAAYWEKKHGFGGVKLDHQAGLQAQMDKIIDGAEKRYLERFEAFKKANASAVKSEIQELIKIDVNNARGKMKTMERYGIETSQLRYDLDRHPDKEKDVIDKFKATLSGETKRLAEESMRAKFVRKYGAFDHEWARADEFGQNSRHSRNHETPKTVRQTIEDQFAKIQESFELAEREKKAGAKSHEGHGNGHGTDMGSIAASIGSGLVSEMATGALGGKKYGQPIALDRIQHLRHILEEAKDEIPEQIVPIPKSADKDMGYARYVHEIFQQHQKDSGRAEIGKRYTEHFDTAHWEDAAIQHLSDDELTSYEYAVKTIAQRIKSGRMDAIALVNLVGDRQKKIVRDDGRSFGPPGIGKDEQAIKEAMKRVIDEQAHLLHPEQEQDNDDIMFGKADMKRALESNDLPPLQRAFMFTLFSVLMGSDAKLCKHLDISHERCLQLRNECKEHFNPLFDAAVILLDEMIKADPDGLAKTLKLTDKEKTLLGTFAERIRSEGKDIADLAENREELKALETVVVNTLMSNKVPAQNDGEGKPASFWTRIVAKAQTIPQMLKEAKGPQESPILKEASMPAETLRNKGFSDEFGSGKHAPSLSAIKREQSRRDASDKAAEIGV